MRWKRYDAKSFGLEVLRASRENADLSMQYMANELEIAYNTVLRWELGKRSPDVCQLLKWFEVLDDNPMPYIMQWLYPQWQADSDFNINALYWAIAELPTADQKRLMYMIVGNHGSKVGGILQMITAHLHLPLRARVSDATIIATQYRIAEGRNKLVHTDRPMPDMDILDTCISAAMQAAIDEKPNYEVDHYAEEEPIF